MTFLFKLVTVILTTFISINLAESSNYTCSHDKMKLLVDQACEIIFENAYPNDNRDKREIWNTKYNTNGINGHKNHNSKLSFDNEMVRVRRKDYPDGGFIRLNINYAKILTNSDNDYRIYHRKYHNKSGFSGDKEYRHKRNIENNNINIHSCCTNICDLEYFCRR